MAKLTVNTNHIELTDIDEDIVRIFGATADDNQFVNVEIDYGEDIAFNGNNQIVMNHVESVIFSKGTDGEYFWTDANGNTSHNGNITVSSHQHNGITIKTQ